SVKDSRGLLQNVLLVPLSSAVITVLVTAPSVRRRITLSRDGISWGNLYPTSSIFFFLSTGALSRPEIKRVVFQRAKDGNNRFPYGIMAVELKYAKPILIAVPNDLLLEKVAQTLHDNGVAVTLADWSPSAAPAPRETS